ncbi:hypothetical protein O6H91_06G063600 [Diphasiastrum complanatum]|uniref:Uncharacterized protein n=2 Tax=Diphasiastrum complanatum TaxID=34168 RepID=A0ACC2DEH9_DIPCM|nr:hypothetical protein O6H91_06G063600 [Diphasiastrum complanatum]KAJ7552661.1 hypothetical protein O6H91_06G063600 [Diphasiastrum complanatum]
MMTFLEEYVSSVGSLPSELKANYSMLRELDSRYQDLQKQMLECHAHGLEDVGKVVKSGCAMPEDLVQKYSTEILAVHNECLALSNDKVTLAVQTYDLVDSHIQRLDKYLQRFKEEVGQGKDLEGEASFADGKVETGRGSRDGEGMRNSRKRGQASALSASVDLDLPVDPNEPTYCYCKQVSFGEMVACDNAECKIEWFHYDCVGIKEQPKGKWYCPDCSSLMRRRRGK